MKLSPLLQPYISQSDGYVRVPKHTLSELEPVHRSSGVDDGLLAQLRDDVTNALSAGYTEWQSASDRGSPHLSIGWDWYLDGASGALLIAGGDVRSNIMGVNRLGGDRYGEHRASAQPQARTTELGLYGSARHFALDARTACLHLSPSVRANVSEFA
jgi:hypothetical protein